MTFSTLLAKTTLLTALLSALLFSVGCGQKGDLYLPQQPQASADIVESSETSDEDEENPASAPE